MGMDSFNPKSAQDRKAESMMGDEQKAMSKAQEGRLAFIKEGVLDYDLTPDVIDEIITSYVAVGGDNNRVKFTAKGYNIYVELPSMSGSMGAPVKKIEVNGITLSGEQAAQIYDKYKMLLGQLRSEGFEPNSIKHDADSILAEKAVADLLS